MDSPAPPDNEKGSPPSYDSLYGQLKAAKESSGNTKDFARTSFGIICGSFVTLIVLALMLAVPVSALVIGAIYVDDCPAQRFIPIYLIVFGCFAIIKDLSSMGQNVKKRRDRQRSGAEVPEESGRPNPVDSLINCFLFAWFIAGNVWVYGLHDEWSSNAAATNYCHPTAYYFAFWLITSSYIIVGLCCLLGFVGLVCCCCLGACSNNE